MRRQFTLRALFGVMTLACGFAAALYWSEPFGIFPLTVVMLLTFAIWPWMFGHGG